MPDSKPPSSTGAVCSLKRYHPHIPPPSPASLTLPPYLSTDDLKISTSALPTQKPNLPDLGTHSLLADWLNTEHRHERLTVRLTLPRLNTKGGCVETNEKGVDGEGKKGL
jgi:hypothetical protein